MYMGFFVGWAGLWVIFGRADMAAIAVALVIVLCVVLFVLLYEEPKLRRLFGEEYVEYCRNVRRWVPRTHAWGKMRRGSDALEGFGYVLVGVAQGYRVAVGCSVLA